MMVRSERDDEAVLLTTGQVARRFKVTLQTLHFYEAEGLIAPHRTHGRRAYDSRSVRRLAFIVEQRRLGLSLKAIANLLASSPLLLAMSLSLH